VTFTVYKIVTYMAGGFLLSAMLILSNNHKCEGQNVAYEHVGQYFYRPIVDLSALFLCNHFTRPLLELACF